VETHTNADTIETGDVNLYSQVVVCTGTFLSDEIHIGACSDLSCMLGTNAAFQE
jgi:tRNA U34 5-carboxymethylaminomethyl modifying enzyme MnmG/GidA